MRATLLQKTGQLNQQLDQLLKELEGLPNEKLNKKPTEDSWSAIQVLHHLLLSEKFSIQYCKKKLSFNPTLKKAGLFSKFRNFGIKMYLASPFKFQAPKAIGSSALPEQDELSSVISQWRSHRQELDTFLNETPDEYLDTEIYRHPFGGRLSLEGMLVFFEAHMKSHTKQIRRAVNP